jgi:hypothetical protein
MKKVTSASVVLSVEKEMDPQVRQISGVALLRGSKCLWEALVITYLCSYVSAVGASL